MARFGPSGSFRAAMRGVAATAARFMPAARRSTEKTGPRIHLYAQCWNDAFMLPFFFRHYDRFVDRYVIYDDGSTDASLAILAQHPRVEVRRFVRSDPASFALSEQALSNQCWKESHDSADWVIVTDLDEHLFHPAMPEYLGQCTASGVTMVPALGFQMISNEAPQDGELLCDLYRHGAPWSQMMKSSIFNPKAIDEINFVLGRHGADPVGDIRVPQRDEVLLLHYKYLGLDQTLARHRELFGGLGATDLANNWGHKYSWSRKELEADWNTVLAAAVNIADFIGDSADRYPLDRWWNRYR